MSTNRPMWARHIYRFVTDTVIDDEYGFPMDGSDDDAHTRIEQAMQAAMCTEWGHEIVFDQCGLPDHRYCVWCGDRIGKLVRTDKDTCEEPR